MLTAGILGFILMLLYDINSYTINCRLLRPGFCAGSLLVGGAMLTACLRAGQEAAYGGAADAVLLLLSAGWLAALIYCLFFALPFEKTYTMPENGRAVYSAGAYALCRHPGVLCFWGMSLCLGLAALPADLLKMCLLYSLLNTLYAYFQDRVTFPRTFCNYEKYRNIVPFLFPNAHSIARAKRTWGCQYGKEEPL